MGDVAAQVGVSRQLVSLVFRNAAGPSADTRDKVLKAASELGYEPDTAAQMLRRNRSSHIGVLLDFNQAFAFDLIEQMYVAADSLGVVLVVGALVSTRKEQQTVEEMLGYRTGAFILVGANLSETALRRVTRQVPVIEIGRGSAGGGTDVVRTSSHTGTELAVDHLIGLDHQTISFIEGSNMPAAHDRRTGYTTAMKRHDLKANIDILPGDYTEEGGSRAARQLLDRPQLPTAVIASNDQSAVGAMMTFSRAGLNVPDQVSVVGYDDSWISRLSYVDLTTIRQNASALAHAAAQAAVERMAGAEGPRREFLLEPELVVRGSTRAPRSNSDRRLRNDGVVSIPK
jgi:DNA-binding LacI/PurR family transcriptional regulator